jgi:hypothetical protein
MGEPHVFLRRAEMRSFKSLLTSKAPTQPEVVDVRPAVQRILTEYVLNMAVTCLARGDVEPLYDQYLQDPRLSDEDREELARAYLLLQMTSVPPSDAE